MTCTFYNAPPTPANISRASSEWFTCIRTIKRWFQKILTGNTNLKVKTVETWSIKQNVTCTLYNVPQTSDNINRASSEGLTCKRTIKRWFQKILRGNLQDKDSRIISSVKQNVIGTGLSTKSNFTWWQCLVSCFKDNTVHAP